MSRLLTPNEIAERLAISVDAVYAKTSARNRDHVNIELPPWIKIGRLVRFPEDDFNDWLKSRPREPNHGNGAK